MKYTVVDSRGYEMFIEADDFILNGEYNCLIFSKCNKNIAMFNINNIIGFYETKECDRE